MRALVLYDSVFGNTEKIAQVIASVVGEHGVVHLAKAGEGTPVEWREFELVVMGGPIHRVALSAAIKSLVKEMPRTALRGASVAVFETCYWNPGWQRGAAARKLARKARKFGGRLVVPAGFPYRPSLSRVFVSNFQYRSASMPLPVRSANVRTAVAISATSAQKVLICER
jgi:menaquinone-dependent protoporphyrinogen IX oxidase